MANTEQCIFCRIVAGEIPAEVVRETERTLAFRDVAPQAPVHVLVIPKEHRDGLDGLVADGTETAGLLLQECAAVAAQEGVTETATAWWSTTAPRPGRRSITAICTFSLDAGSRTLSAEPRPPGRPGPTSRPRRKYQSRFSAARATMNDV